MSRSSLEDEAAATATAWIIIAIALAVALVVAMVVEVVRVYAEWGHADSPVAKPLRRALIAFLLLLSTLVLLAGLQPDFVGPALVVGSWGFLVYVAVVLWLDLQARGMVEQTREPMGQLESHLSPFAEPATATPSRNGQHQPVGEPQL